MSKYAKIVNNEWTGVIYENPISYNNTSFGVNATDDAYRSSGLWPVVETSTGNGDFKVVDTTDTTVDTATQIVTLHYTYRDMTSEEISEINSPILTKKKNRIRKEAEALYDEPVTLEDGTSWNGGMDSALAIDGAVRLAETVGLTEVTLYDSDNINHTVTIADGKLIAAGIAGDYQTKLFAKQAAMRALDDIDLTLTTAKATIDAVSLDAYLP